jgi:hypothetical protein
VLAARPRGRDRRVVELYRKGGRLVEFRAEASTLNAV